MGDVEAFLDDRFTRSPHSWTGDGFEDLLSLRDVDEQLSGAGLRRPAIRVVRDGEILDPATWTRRARTGAVHIDDLVDPGKVLDHFSQGATIVLQSLQRWWPPLARFCRDLERVLGHATQANAYLTPAQAAGLTPHHDTHDVFVLQLHGTKHWTVREPLIVDPLSRHRSDHTEAAEQPILFDAVLRPGDCLYLPRGYIHSASTQSGASLHLTIGVLARTVHDVLRRLVDRAAEEPVFRRTLTTVVAHEPEERREVLKGIAVDFARWLDEAGDRFDDDDVGALLATAPTRGPLWTGQVLELAALGDLDDDRVLELRSEATPATELIDGRIVLDLGDRRVELPAELGPALELLTDGASHRVGELGGLMDRESRLVLARRLVREGVLRSVDGP